jgi:hypothetical protein
MTPDFQMSEIKDLLQRLQGIPCDPIVANFLQM